MCLSAEKEELITNALKSRVQSIPRIKMKDVVVGKNIFAIPFIFENKQDFAARVELSGPEKIRAMEAKFAQIIYENFRDTLEGNADCAVIELNYQIHVAMYFREVRGDLTSPFSDFKALVMDFISKFTRQKQLMEKVRIKSFVQSERISYNAISPFLPEVRSSFVNFRATVEVR